MTYNLIQGNKHLYFYLLALAFPLYKHVILCLLKSRLHCDAVLKVKFFQVVKLSHVSLITFLSGCTVSPVTNFSFAFGSVTEWLITHELR